jgi:hypothetical protein
MAFIRNGTVFYELTKAQIDFKVDGFELNNEEWYYTVNGENYEEEISKDALKKLCDRFAYYRMQDYDLFDIDRELTQILNQETLDKKDIKVAPAEPSKNSLSSLDS